MEKGSLATVTFWRGPRSWIGQDFAVGEVRCLLAALFGTAERVLADEVFVPVIGGGITAEPKNGLDVRLRLRSWGLKGRGRGG